jgi:putative endopeptidase
MTHGFDDSGRKYDKNGNLVNWWTKEDEEQFKLLTDRLEKQFDDVEIAPGVHANGKFTLGENIADQGGLRVALSAYEDSRDGKKPDEIDGFSALQRFYLAYAGVWASNIRPEEILVRTQSDPHSLAENRVNVTLRNLAPFMDAFGIKEGDNMFRKESDRVIIW